MSTLSEPMELKISRFLRAGVLTSGVFMFIGWSGNYWIHFTEGKSGQETFQTLREYKTLLLMDQLKSLSDHPLDAESIFPFFSYVGLFILISLPVIRVLLTSVLFFKNREYILAWIAVFVLLALIGSFNLGLIGSE